MFSLLPREEKFYDLLDAMTGHAEQSCRTLKCLMEETDPQCQQKCQEDLSHIKHEAKLVLQRTVEEVCRSFVTPFDREDIQEMMINLYQIPKVCEKLKERMKVLGSETLSDPGDFTRLTALLLRQAEEFRPIINSLRGKNDLKLISEKCRYIHELEEEGDRILNQLLTELFARTSDPKELFIRRDLYLMLEDVTDDYRDAANIALRVVLKHS